MEINYIIKTNTLTINQILKQELNISTNLFLKLLKTNNIYLNSVLVDTRGIPNIGDTLSVKFDYEEDNSNIIPTKMNLDIIYEDEWLLIVNKPAGIAIHPSVLHYSDSLCNGIKFYFDLINLHKKIRPVNRLDLNTSGLVIFAKCEYIQECLILQMQNHNFKKVYWAICKGSIDKKFDTINLPIARKENSIIERCVSDNGQNSITHYKVLKDFSIYSLVECSLETGRTHQIRVHMSYIKHPLLGDSLYGTSSNLINRQALHCYSLSFIHPISKKVLSFIGKLPLDFKKIIKE